MRALQHLSNLGNNGFSDLSLLYRKGIVALRFCCMKDLLYSRYKYILDTQRFKRLYVMHTWMPARKPQHPMKWNSFWEQKMLKSCCHENEWSKDIWGRFARNLREVVWKHLYFRTLHWLIENLMTYKINRLDCTNRIFYIKSKLLPP